MLVAMSLAAASWAQVGAEWCGANRWGSTVQGPRWSKLYRETYDELKKGDPGTARKSQKRATKLLNEVMDAYVSGPQGQRFLGFTLYLLAVAEYRLDRRDDAAWHWQMAQNLVPALREPPGDFADADPFLAKRLIPAERWESISNGEVSNPMSRELCADAGDVPVSQVKRNVLPPVAKRQPSPSYPEGAGELRVEGKTVIEFIIGSSGVPREPAIRQGCGVTVLDIAAMEAVRSWRYEPATEAGVPVATWCSARFQFALR